MSAFVAGKPNSQSLRSKLRSIASPILTVETLVCLYELRSDRGFSRSVRTREMDEFERPRSKEGRISSLLLFFQEDPNHFPN